MPNRRVFGCINVLAVVWAPGAVRRDPAAVFDVRRLRPFDRYRNPALALPLSGRRVTAWRGGRRGRQAAGLGQVVIEPWF